MLEDMDDEQVMKFYSDQGLGNNDKSAVIRKKEEEEHLFITAVHCENAFYLFSKVKKST